MKKSGSLLWIVKEVYRRISALVVMTVVHVIQAFLGVMFALGSRQVIDCAIEMDRSAFFRACALQGMIIAGIILCLTIYRHLRDRLSADLDRDWKKDMLHSLLNGEYMEVARYHSGELINRLTNDVRMVNEGILTIVPNVSAMLTRMIAAMVVLAALEPWFAAVVFLIGIMVVLITAFMRRRLKDLHKKVSEQDGVVSGFFQEILEKLLMVQAMDAAKEMEHRADGLMESRYQVQRRRKNAALLANTSVSMMSYGAGFISLVWCARKLLVRQMSFGSLTAVIQLVNQLQSPFVSISGVIPQYIAMQAAAERLMELEAIPQNKAVALDSPRDIYAGMKSIEAENVTFSYDRDTVLKNASFEIPKGAFTVITGPSGIGKSTLLKLLLGILPAESGKMYFACEEKDVALYRGTRGMFAYVPQGNLLLSGTIRENLTVVRPDAAEDELMQAVHASGMDEYVAGMPMGLDTVIGENGVGLSEGQAQRLAIARAVLGGAPILLLDECTSALDQQTELTVLERLKGLPDRMCIAVTHRPAALEICDYQLEMDKKTVTCVRR